MRCLWCVVLVLACSRGSIPASGVSPDAVSSSAVAPDRVAPDSVSPNTVDATEVADSSPERTQSGPHAATTVAQPVPTEPVSDLPANSDATVITLFVHEQRVDCHGERPQRCLQTREKPTEEWSYFYDSIAGFEYEESYRYELRVAVSTDPNPPADASSLSYRLVEIVSKQQVGADTPLAPKH